VIVSQKITTEEMECALARRFEPRRNLVVPNVCWGMNIHECDLFVLTQAGYALEIEIKVTKADLKKDAKKWHGHNDSRIKHLYFAIPDYLGDCIEYIPERAGIIVVSRRPSNAQWGPLWRCDTTRKPATNKTAMPFSDAERYKVARLGALRIWPLKRKIRDATATDE